MLAGQTPPWLVTGLCEAQSSASQAAGRAVVAQRCWGSSSREQQLQEMQQGEAPHRSWEQGLAAGEGKPFLGGEGKRQLPFMWC